MKTECPCTDCKPTEIYGERERYWGPCMKGFAISKPEPETSYDKEIFDLGLKVKFLIEQSSKSGAVQYLGICPDEKVLALSEKFSSEEEKAMLDYLNHVKPVETVEGLAEAIAEAELSVFNDTKEREAHTNVIQAARLWLRKQGDK